MIILIYLPTTYMQDEIPVKKENIPTQEDLRPWRYLKEVKLNPINSDIGLLIGSNVPMALEPWKVINSKQNGPYAVQTALGWTVNGPFRKTSVANNGKQFVTAHRISVVQLENLIRQQISKTSQSVSQKSALKCHRRMNCLWKMFLHPSKS